jgi:hypothetical protein
VADSDREAASERLRKAVAEGRLELAELDDRLGLAYAAKTRADLEAATADLPAAPTADDQRPLTVQTKSGSFTKRDHWVVPSRIVASCTSGTIKLDFTHAECPFEEVHVSATATSGSVVLIVPHGWAVVMDNITTTSGSASNKVRTPHAYGAPRIIVQGQVKSGTIKARHPRRSFMDWLLGRHPS